MDNIFFGQFIFIIKLFLHTSKTIKFILKNKKKKKLYKFYK